MEKKKATELSWAYPSLSPLNHATVRSPDSVGHQRKAVDAMRFCRRPTGAFLPHNRNSESRNPTGFPVDVRPHFQKLCVCPAKAAVKTMIETEKFIKCIKNNPTIWKKTAKGYGERSSREICWNIIGQQVFDTWDDKTEEEKQEEVINMKNKWRHMRDSFNKYMNQGKGRFSGVKKRKYIYADNLSFLLQRGHRSAPKSLETQGKEPKRLLVEEDDAYQDVALENRPKSSRKQNTIPERHILTQQQSMKNCVGPTQLEDDPERCYLLSLLPEFKKLNDDQKLDFRFHTLQFFRVIRSKRARRSSELGNGFSENNPLECPRSPYRSPTVSRDGSFHDSLQESANSPPLESVKSEMF